MTSGKAEEWRVELLDCEKNVTLAGGGPTRFVKTLKQCHVFEHDSLPRHVQAQSFQLDTHEDKRSRI